MLISENPSCHSSGQSLAIPEHARVLKGAKYSEQKILEYVMPGLGSPCLQTIGLYRVDERLGVSDEALEMRFQVSRHRLEILQFPLHLRPLRPLWGKNRNCRFELPHKLLVQCPSINRMLLIHAIDTAKDNTPAILTESDYFFVSFMGSCAVLPGSLLASEIELGLLVAHEGHESWSGSFSSRFSLKKTRWKWHNDLIYLCGSRNNSRGRNTLVDQRVRSGWHRTDSPLS